MAPTDKNQTPGAGTDPFNQNVSSIDVEVVHEVGNLFKAQAAELDTLLKDSKPHLDTVTAPYKEHTEDHKEAPIFQPSSEKLQEVSVKFQEQVTRMSALLNMFGDTLLYVGTAQDEKEKEAAGKMGELDAGLDGGGGRSGGTPPGASTLPGQSSQPPGLVPPEQSGQPPQRGQYV